MNFVGIDLHKKTISLCVVDHERHVLNRRQICCSKPDRIVAFFEQLGPFQAVVEATASYEWLIELIEPMADRVVPAHPKKLRIIAETEPRVGPAAKRKSDKLDAQVRAGLPGPGPGVGGGPLRPRPARRAVGVVRRTTQSCRAAPAGVCRVGPGLRA